MLYSGSRTQFNVQDFASKTLFLYSVDPSMDLWRSKRKYLRTSLGHLFYHTYNPNIYGKRNFFDEIPDTHSMATNHHGQMQEDQRQQHVPGKLETFTDEASNENDSYTKFWIGEKKVSASVKVTQMWLMRSKHVRWFETTIRRKNVDWGLQNKQLWKMHVCFAIKKRGM